MRVWITAASAIVVAGVGGLALAQGQAPVRLGPPPNGTVSYRVKADTTSGFGAGMMNARGGLGMLGAMMRGGMSENAFSRSLWLELGSNRPPAGEPSGEHLPPAGVGLGPSIPLITPRAPGSGREAPTGGPDRMERPEGRLLIFWGCGAATRPGQPVVIDFAKMYDQLSPQMRAMTRMRMMQGMRGGPGMDAGVGSAARGGFRTIGEWPNDRLRRTVPAQASLVGDHLVKANYSPDIRFTMAPGQDFLAPLRLTRSDKMGAGAIALAWTAVPNALGYSAMAVGGGRDKTVVIWSSSEVQDGQQPEDFATADQVARLVQAKTVLAPSTTQCAIPAEAARQMGEGGLLTMTAYGPTHSFSFPPRPPKALASWAPDWVTRIATRSTHMSILGMPGGTGMGEDGDPTGGEGEGNARPKKRKSPFGGVKLPF
jgi:hypothetical protein